jgi:hypothetical protein
MLTYVQRKLVDEGLLDACVYISTHYGESDQFDDGSTPMEHVASVVRNLCANDQALYVQYVSMRIHICIYTLYIVYTNILSLYIY